MSVIKNPECYNYYQGIYRILLPMVFLAVNKKERSRRDTYRAPTDKYNALFPAFFTVKITIN